MGGDRGGALVGRGFACAGPQAPRADLGAGMGTGRRLWPPGSGAALPSLVVLRLPSSLHFLGALRVILDWLEFTGGETEVATGDLSCLVARVLCSPAVLNLPRLPVPSLLQKLVPCFQPHALFFDSSRF